MTSLGSISVLSSYTGTYTPNSLALYEPYGAFRAAAPVTNPGVTNHGFTGHRHNNTGDNAMALIYMNARYYLPETGRFISPDTIVPDPQNPQSHNRYSYVLNSPTNLTDPSGHRPCGAFCPGDTINSQEIRHGSNWLGSWDLEQQELNTARAEKAAATGAGILCGLSNTCDSGITGVRVLAGEAGPLETISLAAPIVPGILGRWADDAISWVARAARRVDNIVRGGAIWTPSPRLALTPVENALKHWTDHRGDFPHLNNALEYVEEAHRFVNDPHLPL